MIALADKAARDRIRDDLETTLVVEAAAGTGKTTALVGRILSLVRSGRTNLARIVAVTFTEKAAGEMKIRLRTEIERARGTATGEEAEALEQALRELEAARIGTIHGLCRDLLAERPVEAGIDPMFEIAAEPEASALFGEAFERWFPEVLADPPEGVRRVMRRRATWSYSPRDELRRAGSQLSEHRDFRGRWRRDPFDRTASIDGVVEELATLGELAARARDSEDWLARNLGEIARWVDELVLREATTGRDHDALEAELRFVSRWKSWRWRGRPSRDFGPGLPRDDVLARRDAVYARLEEFVRRCEADLAACLHVELWPLVEAYEQHKKRAGRLDFIDLLGRTRDLLAGDAAVRAELQARFSHVLVDEFQDTDPLQVEIVLLLSAADSSVAAPEDVRVVPGKLFVVGDPKQSIYRFRRADIAIYDAVKRRLIAQGAVPVELSVSFRADPRIQDVVNAAFEPKMQGGAQAAYVALQPFRPRVEGRPAVVALPVPKPYGSYGKVWRNALESSLPVAVGGWVDWVLRHSGWTVDDPEGGGPVPIRSRDICLLFKRFRKWGGAQATDPYVKELEVRGIPHVLVGGRTLHNREEVGALRTALSAIEWPDDELAVFATLRGPLFAVPDDALLAWKSTRGSLHPLKPVDRGEASEPILEVADALSVLGQLHRVRNRRPIADTVGRLLDATRAHAGFANWTAGDQVLANVLRIAELGRQFEAGTPTSFRAFVEHLADQADRGETAQAPVVEEGTEGVRLMTVHKAKGLQFPVVILCDMTAPYTGRNPTRHVDAATRTHFMPIAGCVPIELLENAAEVLERDAEESHRLLYVATTRARDVLVAPAIGDGPEPGWTDLLTPVIYPAFPARRTSGPAPGCPEFGEDTVESRTGSARPGPGTVCPGLHLGDDGVEVVWWDPTSLPEGDRAGHGLRRHWLLVEDDAGVSERGIADHAAWRAAREARLEAGAVPSMRVTTPRELARAAVDEILEGGTEGAAQSTEAPRFEQTDAVRSGRPGGKRFGALVHQSLAQVPLTADRATVEGCVQLQARRVGASPEEAEAAVTAVVAALAHPLLVRAAASPELRREGPIVLRKDDDELVEGTLDLAFLDSDREAGWTVVEFKTALDGAESRRLAEEQLGWYVRAVAKATGLPAHGVLLLV